MGRKLLAERGRISRSSTYAILAHPGPDPANERRDRQIATGSPLSRADGLAGGLVPRAVAAEAAWRDALHAAAAAYGVYRETCYGLLDRVGRHLGGAETWMRDATALDVTFAAIRSTANDPDRTLLPPALTVMLDETETTEGDDDDG